MGTVPQAIEMEDKLGVALKLIRAFELGCATQVSGCLHRFPDLAQYMDNPYDFNCKLQPDESTSPPEALRRGTGKRTCYQ